MSDSIEDRDAMIELMMALSGYVEDRDTMTEPMMALWLCWR